MLVVTLAKGWPSPAQASFAFGEYQRMVTSVSQPLAAIYDAEGMLYVAEGGTSRIHVLDRQGRTLRTIGKWGTRPGQLRQPSGMVWVGDQLWVADGGNDRIQIFSRRGRFQALLEHSPGQAIPFSRPAGLAYHPPSGRVAIADTGNRRVVVHSLTGETAQSFSTDGEQPFLSPVAVAFDSDGLLYIADRGTNRIARIDRDGKALPAWGGYGPHFGLLDEPSGLVWHGGALWVVDRRNHRLQRFRPETGPETLWGTHEVIPHSGQGTLHYPDVLAIAPDGSEAVVGEAIEHRLQVFAAAEQDQTMRDVMPNAGIRDRTHFGPYAAVDAGYLVAAEPENHYMFLFDLRQEIPIIVTKFGERGTGMGLLNRVEGMAILPERREIVTLDSANRRLQFYQLNLPKDAPLRFDPNSVRFAWAVDYGVFEATSSVEFTAIRVGPEQSLFLLDRAKGRVFQFEPDSRKVALVFPKKGASPFQDPTDFAYDATVNRWRVVDRLAGHVWELSAAGDLLGKLGKRGPGKKRMHQPFGIATLPGGEFLVTDSLKDTVLHFNARGKVIGSWGGRGQRMGQFWQPRGISVDGEGRVFVIDQGNHRAQIFTITGEWLVTFGAGKAYTARNLPQDLAPLPKR